MKKIKYYNYWLIAISGLTFWFFIGFPFANSHESYRWVGEVNIYDTFQLLFLPVGHYVSFRPLGQLTALILYKVSNDSLVLIQLFNYLVTVISLLVLILSVNEKRLFSFIALLLGGFLFMGFAHLFHLHGLYYSPVLLLISFLIYYYKKPWSTATLFVTSLIAIIVTLFHPVAAIIYIFYLVGRGIELRKQLSRKQYLLGIIIILINLVIVKVLVPDQNIFLNSESLLAILKIYRSFEANILITLFLVFLSIISVMSIPFNKMIKLSMAGGIIILSALFYLSSIPLMLLVVIALGIKLSFYKRWTILSILISTFLVFVFAGVQSGHLQFLVIFVIGYAIATDSTIFEDKLGLLDKKIGYALIALSCVVVFLLNQNIKIPVVSELANPLLAVKERTHQLERVLEWVSQSDYKLYKITIAPNSSTRSIPTSNENLLFYLSSLRRSVVKSDDVTRSLIICFGECERKNLKVVYTEKGEKTNDAIVYLGSQ